VARRLRQEMAKESTLARIGGDEFAAIVWPKRDESEIPALAERLLVALGRPFRFDVHTPVVGASIGAAIYPQHGREPSLLLRHADMAMYHAKQGGKNRCCLFETPSTVSSADGSHKAA
jgi:diguanylate cyclase (GGDEF)-like protein